MKRIKYAEYVIIRGVHTLNGKLVHNNLKGEISTEKQANQPNPSQILAQTGRKKRVKRKNIFTVCTTSVSVHLDGSVTLAIFKVECILPFCVYLLE
jgi:hypothetical protein